MSERLRIVLVDDVPDIRMFIREALQESERFEVVGEAADGRQGVALAREHQPDVVLLDLSMPVMDGLEALPLIREAAEGVRVVVYSGFEARRMGDQALARGAIGYLEKGISAFRLVDDLIAVLDSTPTPG